MEDVGVLIFFRALVASRFADRGDKSAGNNKDAPCRGNLTSREVTIDRFSTSRRMNAFLSKSSQRNRHFRAFGSNFSFLCSFLT